MDLRASVERLVADFQERTLPPLTRRRLALPSLPGKVDAVVGMRRSGKTFFLYQQILDLLARGVPRSRCLFVNFEDERILPMSAKDLALVPEALWRRFPESRGKECWFFFDEIQNVTGWERFVRRLVDSESARVVLSGSSAKLLGREIATSLRGRSLATEVLPFSFAEALDHAGVPVPERWPPPAPERSVLENRFQHYLRTGGFPEVQTVAPDLRVRILQEYLEAVILRDVAERHGIANLSALRYVARRLVRSPGGKFTVHRLYNDLKSLGHPAGKDALHEYVGHLQDAFLLFPVELESRSERRRRVNPRKAYLVDHGLVQALTFGEPDVGHLLENVVFLEARRRGSSLTYYVTASGFEVDFLARKPTGERALLQVCASLSDAAVRDREVRALDEAIGETGLGTGTIVTVAEEETLRVEGRTVRVVPAWRWLLEPE